MCSWWVIDVITIALAHLQAPLVQARPYWPLPWASFKIEPIHADTTPSWTVLPLWWAKTEAPRQQAVQCGVLVVFAGAVASCQEENWTKPFKPWIIILLLHTSYSNSRAPGLLARPLADPSPLFDLSRARVTTSPVCCSTSAKEGRPLPKLVLGWSEV